MILKRKKLKSELNRSRAEAEDNLQSHHLEKSMIESDFEKQEDILQQLAVSKRGKFDYIFRKKKKKFDNISKKTFFILHMSILVAWQTYAAMCIVYKDPGCVANVVFFFSQAKFDHKNTGIIMQHFAFFLKRQSVLWYNKIYVNWNLLCKS